MFTLFTHRPRLVPPRRKPCPLPAVADDGSGAYLGCGWFDSSHELQQGLLATELPPDAPLPAVLALEICLAA
jgi:hypothetical protein